jgi:hypothetical protein
VKIMATIRSLAYPTPELAAEEKSLSSNQTPEEEMLINENYKQRIRPAAGLVGYNYCDRCKRAVKYLPKQWPNGIWYWEAMEPCNGRGIPKDK